MSEALPPVLRGARGQLDAIQELFAVQPLPEPASPHTPSDGSIALNNVHFRYAADKPDVLNGVSLNIAAGSMVALIGESGSGKTTLARLIARFFDVSQGSVSIGSVDVRQIGSPVLATQISQIFQDDYLFAGSIADNIRLGRPDASDDEVQQAAMLAQAHGFISGLPQGHATRCGEQGMRLSGGQRQRIALARALAVEPKVLLLDEPFGALDAKVRKELRRWLARLHEDINLTSVFVTHDQEEAMEVADRIVVMNKGVIEQIGSPGQVYENPASDFVYHFLGDSNRLHLGEDNHVLFRPHEVSLSRHELEDHHAAEVRDIRPLGATTRVTLKVEGQSELIEAEVVKDHDSLTGLAKGETLFFKPKVWQKVANI